MAETGFEVSSNGDYSVILHSLRSLENMSVRPLLHKYAQIGVEYLQNATPIDSGKTRDSWYYEIEDRNGTYRINFCNSNTNKGVNIAIVLEYGHVNSNGGWVEGYDYIDPAISATFDEMVDELCSKIGRY